MTGISRSGCQSGYGIGVYRQAHSTGCTRLSRTRHRQPCQLLATRQGNRRPPHHSSHVSIIRGHQGGLLMTWRRWAIQAWGWNDVLPYFRKARPATRVEPSGAAVDCGPRMSRPWDRRPAPTCQNFIRPRKNAGSLTSRISMLQQ